jgi:mRNA interferase MazF
MKANNSEKNFDKWNNVKKQLNKAETIKFCKEREIWWCFLGLNVGFEQNGDSDNFKRPILILKKLSLETVLVVPLTKSEKNHRFRIKIGLIDGHNAAVIMSQIKVVDVKRLSSKICMLNKNHYNEIKKAFRILC